MWQWWQNFHTSSCHLRLSSELPILPLSCLCMLGSVFYAEALQTEAIESCQTSLNVDWAVSFLLIIETEALKPYSFPAASYLIATSEAKAWHSLCWGRETGSNSIAPGEGSDDVEGIIQRQNRARRSQSRDDIVNDRLEIALPPILLTVNRRRAYNSLLKLFCDRAGRFLCISKMKSIVNIIASNEETERKRNKERTGSLTHERNPKSDNRMPNFYFLGEWN